MVSGTKLDVSAGVPTRYNMTYVWLVSMAAALGGLLFGYDWVVIGGAKPFYEKYFQLLNPSTQGWAMSCALVGCLVGAILAGGLSDKYGRKRLLLLSGFLFALTSIGTGMASAFTEFVIWRILGGIAIGLASNLSPMYIAEVAPASIRGKLVSINQLTIVIGILAAQFTNWLIARPVPPEATPLDILNSWNGQSGWRWMFGVTAVPAVFFFLCMFLVPESPRWLAKSGKHEKAKDVLAHIGGEIYARQTLTQIEETLVNEIDRVNFRDLSEPKMVRILLLGVTIAVLQQWCGINVIFNYAEEVFTAAGYKVSDILFNIVITGIVNLAFTFVAIHTVDRLGRRVLMLAGWIGLSMLYVLIGASYFTHTQGVYLLILVVGAIGCYGCTLAPVTWVVLAEIFPNRIRGAAMSISVFALWIGCFALTFTFPILNRVLGPASTFWTYAAICVFGFFFVKLRLPETKGKTLEQIEKDLLD
ncbi:MAG TPA: sugar porter family MFS transporter [Terriglobia bacterium]|nr:sugar porter family MFS transporter [Terriglobia bacterium]